MDACTVYKKIAEATDLVEIHFNGRARALAWMMAPNSDLDNEIPRILFLRGDGEKVFKLLKTLTK